ncbi:hypothetical protein [uncultured Erythrobacter sp.]|uniref:hypothetical protein n=1 Tax=uncultured Erythrobacter sp. TaxID=263913 RepID=UPI002621CA9F|nr:hypothetical protein [uncultured Erythrobacter sp.]
MHIKTITAVLFALLLAACNPMAQLDGATEEIERFHSTYNQGDARALYGQTGQEFRDVTAPEDMDALIEHVTEFMGKMESTSREGFNINTNNGMTTTVVTMKTVFEKGEAIETFTFRGQGEDLRLVGWNVDSPNFMVEPATDSAPEPAEAE